MYVDMKPDEAALLEQVREFVATEVLPHTREWEKNAAFPDEIWPKLGALGLLGMTLPKTQGGTGLSCTAFSEVCREIAKGDPALSMNVAAINALCVGHFENFATQEQIDKYVPGILKGDIKLA